MNRRPHLCYLCGEPLSEPVDRDHVPPKQFYADQIRREQNLNLLRISVHAKCNKCFQLDEDYFVYTLMPFAKGSHTGDAIYAKVLQKFRRGEKTLLVHRVLRECDHHPSGLVLPGGQIVKRFEGLRLHRIAWKIVRGLHFHHSGEVLPSGHRNKLRISVPNERPPDDFFLLAEEPTRGEHPGVFDYKFARFPEAHNFHYWQMLLWDRLILLVTFHDPFCQCDACVGDRQVAARSAEEHESAPNDAVERTAGSHLLAASANLAAP